MEKNKKKIAFLKTVSDFKKIHDHPLNNSKSKQMVTFPKSKRFTTQISNSKEITCLQNLSNFFNSKRSCSFGKGNKIDFTQSREKNLPGPNHYFGFSQKRNSNPSGFSFGESRDKCLILGLKNEKENLKIPGVGTYHIVGERSNKNAFSFRIKTQGKDKSNFDIGPGKYMIKSTFGKDNCFFISKYKNPGMVKINPEKKNKSKIDFSINPQFLFQPKNGINGSGRYFNSNFKDSKIPQFPKQKKNVFHQNSFNTPGPGNYILPSDFGIYLSSTIN
jgi:hypothetical protein